MLEFKSLFEYERFESHIKRELRYIADSETRGFLNTVLSTCKKRLKLLKKGSTLWRAQLGNEYVKEKFGVDKPVPYKKSRMKPLRERAKEGRINPKGIPVLYLSDDRDTAMAEIRPWTGSYISLAQLQLKQNINIVDCSQNNDIFGLTTLLKPNPTSEEKEGGVWHGIGKAFSKPITNTDEIADYAPTQIIAELFKNEGYNGIGYRSSLSDGLNLTLFEVNAADIVDIKLYEVKKIEFEFKEYVHVSVEEFIDRWNKGNK